MFRGQIGMVSPEILSEYGGRDDNFGEHSSERRTARGRVDRDARLAQDIWRRRGRNHCAVRRYCECRTRQINCSGGPFGSGKKYLSAFAGCARHANKRYSILRRESDRFVSGKRACELSQPVDWFRMAEAPPFG